MYDGYPAAEYTTERKMEGKIQWRGDRRWKSFG